MQKRFVGAIIVFFLVISVNVAAEECSELESSLRFELYKQMPQFEIAFPDVLPEAEQEKLVQKGVDPCSYLVVQGDSAYVLLKDKQDGLYRVIYAQVAEDQTAGKWSIQTVCEFADDIPTLEKVRAGYYSDIDSGDKLTVTRNSMAVQVSLLHHEERYIYKNKGETGFDRCRIR